MSEHDGEEVRPEPQKEKTSLQKLKEEMDKYPRPVPGLGQNNIESRQSFHNRLKASRFVRRFGRF